MPLGSRSTSSVKTCFGAGLSQTILSTDDFWSPRWPFLKSTGLSSVTCIDCDSIRPESWIACTLPSKLARLPLKIICVLQVTVSRPSFGLPSSVLLLGMLRAPGPSTVARFRIWSMVTFSPNSSISPDWSWASLLPSYRTLRMSPSGARLSSTIAPVMSRPFSFSLPALGA